MPDGPDKELYSFAYWDCFQLERYVCTFYTSLAVFYYNVGGNANFYPVIY